MEVLLTKQTWLFHYQQFTVFADQLILHTFLLVVESPPDIIERRSPESVSVR